MVFFTVIFSGKEETRTSLRTAIILVSRTVVIYVIPSVVLLNDENTKKKAVEIKSKYNNDYLGHREQFP